MELALSVILTALDWIVQSLSALFDLLFFWLPGDFLSMQINSVGAVVRANSQAIAWLNWFIDVPFFVLVFSLAVSALLLWTGFRITMWLMKKATDAVNIVVP